MEERCGRKGWVITNSVTGGGWGHSLGRRAGAWVVADARLSISTSDFKRMSHPVLAVEREAQSGDAIRGNTHTNTHTHRGNSNTKLVASAAIQGAT